MSNAFSPQLLTSHKLYFEFTSQTQYIAHASSRLFSGRIPELEWAAEIEPTIAAMLVFKLSCKLAMCYAGGQTLE